MKSADRVRCDNIIHHYGIDKQSLKACEEMGELIQVISKLRCNYSKNEVEHLKEEIADVMVVLEQIKIWYGITNSDINEIIEQKTIRTMKRVDAEGF